MIGSDVGAVVGGLVNSMQGQPSLNLQALFQQIAASGANERTLINNLPASLQPLYAQYKTSLGAAGTALQNTTNTVGQTLEDKTAALYGPASPAVTATLAALKQQDYSTQPGTLNALRAQLAATGGLARGGAQKALTQAVLAPAATFSQQAATVTGQQLTAQQQAQQAAINKVASMDETTAQSLFGMSKEEATQILTSGRQDLQQQLTQLVNQANTETNQNLNILGLQANNQYQNAVAKNANNTAIVNGLVNLGVDAYTGGMGGGSTGPSTGGYSGDFNDLSQQGLVSTPPPGYQM